MKRLEQQLRDKLATRRLLVAYVTAGYPDERRFLELIPALEQAGVDAVEIGLPFSDPLADGPVIQRASAAAIENGMTTQRALELAGKLSSMVEIPLLAMGYMNPLLSHGIPRFLDDAAQAGLSGLILPDLPLDGDRTVEQQIADSSLARVQLVTPASGRTRIARLARAAEGFLYLVSRLGVTGGKLAANSMLPQIIETLRSNSDLPLLTGFGISDATAAGRAAALCDGVIVGSALLEKLDNDNAVYAAARFCQSLRCGIDDAAREGSIAAKESLT